MIAKSLHMFKNWLEKWHENPLCVTKLLPLVQKCIRGKSLEEQYSIRDWYSVRELRVQHEHSAGVRFLLIGCEHCGWQAEDSASPGRPRTGSLWPFSASHSSEEMYFEIPEWPQSTLWTMSQTLIDFPKMVFNSHLSPLGHALRAVGRYMLSNQHVRSAVRRGGFNLSLPDAHLPSKEPCHIMFSPLTTKEKCLSWKY